MPKARETFEIAPDSSGPDCNTQTNPVLLYEESKPESPEDIKKQKQIPQRVHHFFTYNNYDSSIIPILISTLDNFCYAYCFQEEIGEKNGVPHLQGVISCKRKMRDTELGLPKQIHWMKPIDIGACYRYCSKANTRAGGLWYKGVKIIRPVRTITELYPWQQKIVDIIKTEPDGQLLHWYWEANGGVGKSAFCKYMAIHHKVPVIQGGKMADIMNIIFNLDMNEVTAIIIDIPRAHMNKVSYASIECILNGMITNTKYETGMKYFNPPHVIVFSNFEPERDESTLSERRWRVTNLGID